MSTRKAKAATMGNDFIAALEQLRQSETYDKESVRADISDQIHAAMEREEVKPAELARRLGKSRAYITKILQGNANFTIDSLVQIARALGYRYAPVFLPKFASDEAIYQNARELHLSARSAQPTPEIAADEDDYIPVKVDAGGGDDEESSERRLG
jgi:transcriptional regulator with XRE-family HTH domain